MPFKLAKMRLWQGVGRSLLGWVLLEQRVDHVLRGARIRRNRVNGNRDRPLFSESFCRLCLAALSGRRFRGAPSGRLCHRLAPPRSALLLRPATRLVARRTRSPADCVQRHSFPRPARARSSPTSATRLPSLCRTHRPRPTAPHFPSTNPSSSASANSTPHPADTARLVRACKSRRAQTSVCQRSKSSRAVSASDTAHSSGPDPVAAYATRLPHGSAETVAAI